MADIRDIKAAGDYLLSRLRKKRLLTYQEFVGGSLRRRRELARGIWSLTKGYPALGTHSLPSDTTERYFLSRGRELIRDAAWQLHDIGLIRIHWPGRDDSGGRQELAFELTDRGERFLERGESFGYRKVLGNRFDFAPASLWLIEFALARRGGPVTLGGAMEQAEKFGTVVVADDSGNRYTTPATNTFAWAFEAALWHHAVNSHVEPTIGPKFPKPWRELLGRPSPPPRPSIDGPWPIREVPFRLAASLDLNELWHLGVVVGG